VSGVVAEVKVKWEMTEKWRYRPKSKSGESSMKLLHMRFTRQQNREMFQKLAMVLTTLLAWCCLASAQHWVALPTFPGNGAGTAILQTDGDVLVQELTGPASGGGSATGNWYVLHPDASGSYETGFWGGPVSTISYSYAPLYFASAVLPDSRIIIEGGEYNFGFLNDTVGGTLYNPTTASFHNMGAPKLWAKIGDAPSVILPNGRFMMGDCCSTNEAILNPTTLSWTSTGAGKADPNSEEGWTLLPNGKVLTVDTQNGSESELYNYTTGKWSLAGNTYYHLPYNCANPKIVPEVGPAVLRPNGTVLATGANGYTSIYHVTQGNWTKGPIFPPNSAGQGQDGVADGPAALLVDGNVLVMASNINPCNITPSDFFEFNGTKFVSVPGPPNASNEVSFDGRMLVLPNGGHILFTDGTTDVEAYIPVGAPNSSWAPTISSFPATITQGGTYTLKGTQFNGLSQGAAYGDDSQSATNFPLVRLTIHGIVNYLPTKHFTMGVATGTKVVQTAFTLPFFVGKGAATLEVVANGIPSKAVSITVK
jgi:hypothetical protein